jgi:tetratricopeptide (TPR) repeat protein
MCRRNPSDVAQFLLGFALWCAVAGIAYCEQSIASSTQPPLPLGEAASLLKEGKANQAKQILQHFLGRAPASVDGWTLLGQAYVQLGSDAEARHSYERALRLDARAEQALYNLGILELRSGRLTSAAKHLGAYHSVRPGDAYVLLPLAHCLFRLGRTTEWKRVLNEAFEAGLNSPEWDLEAGKMLLTEGLALQAVKPLTEALQLQPDSSEARLSLALAESQLAHPERVAQLLSGQPLPDSPLYSSLLGSALCQLGRCDEGVSILQAAKGQWIEDKSIYVNLASAYEETSKGASALSVLQEAHQRWPDDIEIRYKLARRLLLAHEAMSAISLLAPIPNPTREELELLTECYVAVRSFEEARQTAAKAVAQFGTPESSLLALANVLQLQGKDPEVISLLEAHRTKSSATPRFLFTLGLSYYRVGKYKASRDLLEKVVVLDPSLAQAQFLIGSSYSSLGQPQEALPHYKAAVDLEPKNFLYQFQVGLVLSLLGQKAAGEEYLRRSIEINGSHAPARYHLAEIYFESGRYELAQQELEQAIELNPGFDSSYYLLSRVYSRLGKQQDAVTTMKRFQEIKDQARTAATELKQGGVEGDRQ